MSGEWLMKDDFERFDRLETELARVRGERDRAVEAATYFQRYRDWRKPERSAAVERAISWIGPWTVVGADLAARLAAHDRRAGGSAGGVEGERCE